MEIPIFLRKSLQENAAILFEKSKQAKRKAQGAKKAIEKLRARLEELEAKQVIPKLKFRVVKEREWYEKFRWFFTSEGLLCIGGRDASTNEIVVKRHAEPNDLVFHTFAPGSPFFVLKCQNRPSETSLEEAAIATASFSKAWKLGIASLEVFWVKPEQLTKQAPPGEYVPKGAFLIRGRKNTKKVQVNLAVGVLPDGKVMCGPPSAVRSRCTKFVLIKPGRTKPSDAAKQIQKILGIEIDEIIRVLPSGGCEVKEEG